MFYGNNHVKTVFYISNAGTEKKQQIFEWNDSLSREIPKI